MFLIRVTGVSRKALLSINEKVRLRWSDWRTRFNEVGASLMMRHNSPDTKGQSELAKNFFSRLGKFSQLHPLQWVWGDPGSRLLPLQSGSPVVQVYWRRHVCILHEKFFVLEASSVSINVVPLLTKAMCSCTCEVFCESWYGRRETNNSMDARSLFLPNWSCSLGFSLNSGSGRKGELYSELDKSWVSLTRICRIKGADWESVRH